jgi:glycosyltransferase involved in cell wall biosynthesis
LTYQKAPDVWLAAATRIIKKYPQVHFIQGGSGGSQMEKAIRRSIQELGLSGRIHLLGNRSDIPELLAATDVFVLPSRFEGLSTSLLEALAVGVPSIATNVSGNPEAVEDGVTGLLIPVDDEQALATAIEQLINDRALRERLGATAAARTRTQFSPERQTQEFARFLSRILT